ncbi:MAG: D-alanine--D-alanine ligase [Pseudomonadota bacterium]
MSKKVLVLKGGWCAEREVSISSGAQSAAALRSQGYLVEELDVTRSVMSDIQGSFEGAGPDVVFNALHGPFGEDGRIQSVLELLEIPYTHSGVLASALSMDKPKAKAVLAAQGLPVPEGRTVLTSSLTGQHLAEIPYVLKPIADGSSFGVYIIKASNQAAPTGDVLDDDLFGGVAMVETFIPGRELTVAVLGDQPLAVTEIIANKGTFYDFESKYTPGGSEHVLPAQIPEEIAAAAMQMASKAAQALGCRGLSRTDFRWDDRAGVNGLFILEVNTQPGLTPTSLAPEQAAVTGMEFGALVRWMVEDASCPR